MTAYRVETIDGGKEVVKVLNPNALFHLENTKKFVTSIINQLEAIDPQKYAVARFVLDEVSDWITRDISFKGFLASDATFRARHDGFQPVGFSYRVHVPQSRPPASQYFIREQFVEGKNLTQWEELQREGNDMKEIVSLLVRSALEQLGSGQVHSDMHPGNFRVTPDKKVAILDRNFYLTITPQAQKFLEMIADLGVSPEEKLDQFFAVCGVSPTREMRGAVLEELNKTLGEVNRGNWSAFMDFLVTIRSQQLRLPLEVTLLFKNMNVLQGFAHRAGFANMMEAYFYTPAI